MGDRYYSYSKCPKCGDEMGVETYDAPSCLIYFVCCQRCNWRQHYTEDLNYYEIGEHEIILCTKKEYNEKHKHTEFCQKIRSIWLEDIKEDLRERRETRLKVKEKRHE